MLADCFPNPGAAAVVPAAGFGPEDRAPLRAHRQLPGYARTPLRDLPDAALALGVARVLLKDESRRLGLPSFKILGASWATLTAVAEHWLDPAAATEPLPRLAERLAAGPPGRRLAAATDGNHGRGVARMAALLGLPALILVPAGTAPARVAGIEAEGAEVRVVDGTYDDAVAASAELAGYEKVPRAVIEGYSTMFHEIDDEVRERALPAPTVVAVQAGVGAFAAAALRHYRGPAGTGVRTVVVEPDTAACLLASARAGRLTAVSGPHPSRMAGLNCGLPSRQVWPVVAAGTDVFLAVADEAAYAAMRLLARAGVEAGESGAASLGGLLAAVDAGRAQDVGLRPASTVLLVNTEGATDPDNYAAVVGRTGR
jgi:diaminopropionate ammonia-lyase